MQATPSTPAVRLGCSADRCPRTLAREGCPRFRKKAVALMARAARAGRARTRYASAPDREGTVGDDAFSAPLPEQADHRRRRHKVIRSSALRADCLDYRARACRIQQLQERTVTQADGRIVRGDVEQAPHLSSTVRALGRSSRARGRAAGRRGRPLTSLPERVLV